MKIQYSGLGNRGHFKYAQTPAQHRLKTLFQKLGNKVMNI